MLIIIGVIFLILFWFTWIAALSVVIYYNKHPVNFYNERDLSYIYQISNDWQQQPFTNMIITTNPTCPTNYPFEVFYDVFGGAVMMCDCIEERNRNEVIFNDYCHKGKNGRDRSSSCYTQPALPPVV